MRILFVDDNDLVRRSLGRVLTRGGHEVVTCASADEALLEIERGPHYDLMISDFDLGHATSDALVAEVRERFPDTRVMLLTATPQQILPAGIPVIVKPVSGAELLLAIEPHAA